MKMKLLLLCASAVFLPVVSSAQGGVAVRVLESGSEKLIQQGSVAVGTEILINAESGLGAAGNALKAAGGKTGEKALSYPGAKASGPVTEDKVRKAVKSQCMAEYVSRHSFTILGPLVDEAPACASAEDLKEIEQAVADNLTAPRKTPAAVLLESRAIMQTLQAKAAEYSEIIKDPSSPDKPEFLTFNELTSALILKNPKKFISYVKEQTKNKEEISYSKFVIDVMEKARTTSFNFQYHEKPNGPAHLFLGAFVYKFAYVPKEEILKKLYHAWYLGEPLKLNTTIRSACEAAASSRPNMPAAYFLYEIPLKEQYLDYHLYSIKPKFELGNFNLDTKTIPGTVVYKFNPFNMTWELYGKVK